jgi:hypothetical protein
MKKLCALVFLLVAGLGGNVYGDDGWGPYVYRSPVLVQPAPIVQMVPYYHVVPVPVVVMVPLAPQYFPVTTYQNVLVERRYHCFLKRYEVVSVPQTVYVPIRY